MDVTELETKLAAAQERLDKAIVLKDKYTAKRDSLEAKLTELGFPPRDNSVAALRAFDTPNEVWDMHFSWAHARDAVQDSDRKIKELTQIRDNWKTKLALEQAKNSELETIPAVVKEFVHSWRLRVFDFYIKLMNEYVEERKAVRELYNTYYNAKYSENSKELYAQYEEAWKALKKKYTDPIVTSLATNANREEELNKLLDREERSKILDLVKRVTKVTGDIQDASNLRIGEQNGELNGIVIGKDGKCYVETIGAGGHSEHIIVNDKHGQRFHYRVLVKKLS